MDITEVRRVAESYGCEEVVFSAAEGLVVFQRGPIAIQIWYRSGTVAISTPHPRRDNYSYFVFDVDNGEALSAVFASPYAPSRGRPAAAALTQLASGRQAHAAGAPLESEARALRRQLEDVRYEMEDLRAEEMQLTRRLEEIGADREDEGQANRGGNPVVATAMPASSGMPASSPGHPLAQAALFTTQKSTMVPSMSRSASALAKESPPRYKGNRCLYCFSKPEYQATFAKVWADKPVSSVALGVGYVVVYEDGGVAWWDVPKALDQKLRDEAQQLPPVKLVALGPQDAYFIKFSSGKMEWVSNSSFQAALHRAVEEQGLLVSSVSFGQHGSWVITFTDGSVQWSNGAPADLRQLLTTAAAEGPSVRDVSLGPAGEWFCILADNSVQANNVPDSLHDVLSQIKGAGGRVRSIQFGQNGSWYLRYWDGKLTHA